MSDVIDEDLMRELGLDADDLKAIEDKKKSTPSHKTSAAQSKHSASAEIILDSDDLADDLSEPASFTEPSQHKREVQKQPEDDLHAFNAELAQDVPVQLAVVLAKKTLNLGQVFAMRIGEVIELGRKPTDAIDLVANGKLVAKAELVMVDGQVGVRILKLIK